MLKCGFYEREITPPLGKEIPGYYAKRVSTGVLDRLYAKAVVLDNGEEQLALVVLDAIQTETPMHDAIVERICANSGLKPENITVTATHTHLGIPMDEPIGSKGDPAYMDWLCLMAADCVLLALQNLKECTLQMGMGRVEGVSFNRDYVLEDGVVCTNPGSKRKIIRPYSENDPELPVLSVRDLDGNYMGALISFACHQDCIGGTAFSGDFSSELSRQLKNRYGGDFVSIYLAGACGDINHLDAMGGSRMDYRTRGQRIAEEAVRVMERDSKPVSGNCLRASKEKVVCTYRRATAEELAAAHRVLSGQPDPNVMLGSLMAQLLLTYEENAEKRSKEVPILVQVLRIGDAAVFAMPGEMYHQFGNALKNADPEKKCLVATLSNGSYWGYIPISELFGTYIYPAALCDGSCLTPDAGWKLTNAALEQYRQLFSEKD